VRRFQRFLMASAVITAAGTTGRVACAAEDTPADQPNDSMQLEQITVTATKRAERLQDVPVAVTALTSDTLERNNVRELGDLVKLSPSLTITYGSQPGNFAISMRGIGTFSNGIAVESDVAVVIDDVPLGYQAEAFMDLIDVDRVEVLRGPQSTLFGKSAIAGVLNITTAAPTAEFTAKAMGYYTNDGEKRAGMTLSGPLSDTLRYRLTVDDSDYDGNVTNIYNGQKVNGSSGLTVSGKLEWLPTDNLTFTLSPRFNRNESTCCASPITSLPPGLYYQGATQLPESLVLKGIPIGPSNHYIDMDYRDGGGDSRTYGATGKVNYNFSEDSFLHGYSFQSISSDDHWRMFDYQDQDGTAVPFLLYYPLSAPSGIDSGAYQHGYFEADSVTQEFRLTSPGETRLRYVAGLWYAENNLDRYLWKGPVLNAVSYLGVTGNVNYAAYANATYDLTDKLSLVGGYRRNLQKIDYTFINYSTNLDFGKHNQEWSNTGKAGLEYKWTPDIMTYATFSTGYKGQAYDLVSTFSAKEAAVMPVPHELAHSYEVGIKSSLFDRRMYLNFDLFDTNYHGFQTSITSALPNGTFLSYLQSVGQLRTRGAEFDAALKATANLTLNASYAYTRATVVTFNGAPCYTGQTPAQGCNPITTQEVNPADPNQTITVTGPTGQNLAGKALNNVPLNKFDIGGEYDHALGNLPFGGFLSFDSRFQSAVNFSLNQDPKTVQGAYGISNFSAGINDNHDHYRVSVFVDNAFNNHYAVSIADSLSGFAPAGGGSTTGLFGSTWTPARDSFRYYGARVDVKF
jgi:iron complex outermembrane receptor protein